MGVLEVGHRVAHPRLNLQMVEVWSWLVGLEDQQTAEPLAVQLSVG